MEQTQSTGKPLVTEPLPTLTAEHLHVAPSPHMNAVGMTTLSMMADVILALVPAVVMALVLFGRGALLQIAVCILSCLVAEAIFTRMRGRTLPLLDLSATVTGLILALSLPATAPWYVGVIAGTVAIGIGKTVFGGLGMNLFNPAMVGRAFVMISFAGQLGAGGYVSTATGIDIMSQATPLTAYQQSGVGTALSALFLGFTNGSIGETSALACLLGGIYLCVRRTASWQIPAAILITVFVIGAIANLMNPASSWTVLHHLFGGSLMFGAFFIATDPVSSPLTPRGKWIFGAGIGAIVMLLRLFSGYPEGVMFAVLLMNALTPLINRATIPRPFGGA